MNTRNRLALSSEKNDFARVLSAYLVLLKTRDTRLCKMELDGRGNSHEGVDCYLSTPPANFSAPRYQKWKPSILITFHSCFLCHTILVLMFSSRRVAKGRSWRRFFGLWDRRKGNPFIVQNWFRRRLYRTSPNQTSRAA
jgi:hypothetical protein